MEWCLRWQLLSATVGWSEMWVRMGIFYLGELRVSLPFLLLPERILSSLAKGPSGRPLASIIGLRMTLLCSVTGRMTGWLLCYTRLRLAPSGQASLIFVKLHTWRRIRMMSGTLSATDFSSLCQWLTGDGRPRGCVTCNLASMSGPCLKCMLASRA